MKILRTNTNIEYVHVVQLKYNTIHIPSPNKTMTEEDVLDYLYSTICRIKLWEYDDCGYEPQYDFYSNERTRYHTKRFSIDKKHLNIDDDITDVGDIIKIIKEIV